MHFYILSTYGCISWGSPICNLCARVKKCILSAQIIVLCESQYVLFSHPKVFEVRHHHSFEMANVRVSVVCREAGHVVNDVKQKTLQMEQIHEQDRIRDIAP